MAASKGATSAILLRMRELDDPIAHEALIRLEQEDARLAAIAGAALEALTLGHSLATTSQHRLQTFLWYELPLHGPGEGIARDKRVVARALGRLLELAGFTRYAALCASPTTMAVLDAYEQDRQRGIAAYEQAVLRSGVEPPDLPELVWGSAMGASESAAYQSTAAALELAIASRVLFPGASGWRSKQRALARDHLAAPRPELGGRTWFDAVLDERVTFWVERSRGELRRRLAAPLAGRLRSPVPPPPGLATSLAPVRWLLAQAAAGLPLTARGELHGAVAEAAARRFGWPPEAAPLLARELQQLACGLGALRRAGGQVTLTRAGLALERSSPERLWQAVASALGEGEDPATQAREILLLLLLREGGGQQAALVAATRSALSAEGTPPDPRVPDPATAALDGLLALARLLRLAAVEGAWPHHAIKLNEVGRATALQILRSRATGPRHATPR